MYYTRHFYNASFKYIVKFARIKTYLQIQPIYWQDKAHKIIIDIDFVFS